MIPSTKEEGVKSKKAFVLKKKTGEGPKEAIITGTQTSEEVEGSLFEEKNISIRGEIWTEGKR